MDPAALCVALGETKFATELRESLWTFPLIETVHVLALGLMTGTIAIFDLRLLGWALREEPVLTVQRRVLPLTRLGAAVMVVSGALLFVAGAAKLYYNPAFRCKILLLVLAGLNPLLFHWGAGKRVADWDPAQPAPLVARATGAASLLLWTATIVAGRAIAYL